MRWVCHPYYEATFFFNYYDAVYWSDWNWGAVTMLQCYRAYTIPSNLRNSNTKFKNITPIKWHIQQKKKTYNCSLGVIHKLRMFYRRGGVHLKFSSWSKGVSEFRHFERTQFVNGLLVTQNHRHECTLRTQHNEFSQFIRRKKKKNFSTIAASAFILHNTN